MNTKIYMYLPFLTKDCQTEPNKTEGIFKNFPGSDFLII